VIHFYDRLFSSVFRPFTINIVAQRIRASMATQNAEDVEMIEARPRKRIRNSTKRKRATSPLPRVPLLFAPFRALGLITNHIPFYMQTRSYKDATEGPRIHILTCLGRSWALWEGGKMGLLFVGELLVYLGSEVMSDTLV